MTHGAARVCYAKGWKREHEGGESLSSKSSSLCWLRSSVYIWSSSTCCRLRGDSPSAEGVEGHEVKGHCCFWQQCQICFAHCSRHMYACIYIYMYVCMYMYMCICMDVYICVRVCAFVCVYICMYMYVCIYIYVSLFHVYVQFVSFSIGE